MSEPTLLPPYHRGSATSRLVRLLETGHEGVELNQEERDKLACWIDLLVPFCGDYREHHAWSLDEQALYARALEKRERMLADETANIAAWVEQQAARDPTRATTPDRRARRQDNPFIDQDHPAAAR